MRNSLVWALLLGSAGAHFRSAWAETSSAAPEGLPPERPVGSRPLANTPVLRSGSEEEASLRVRGLLKKLGDEDGEVREGATSALLAMGTTASPWVGEEGARTADAEVRNRCRRILTACAARAAAQYVKGTIWPQNPDYRYGDPKPVQDPLLESFLPDLFCFDVCGLYLGQKGTRGHLLAFSAKEGQVFEIETWAAVASRFGSALSEEAVKEAATLLAKFVAVEGCTCRYRAYSSYPLLELRIERTKEEWTAQGKLYTFSSVDEEGGSAKDFRIVFDREGRVRELWREATLFEHDHN